MAARPCFSGLTRSQAATERAISRSSSRWVAPSLRQIGSPCGPNATVNGRPPLALPSVFDKSVPVSPASATGNFSGIFSRKPRTGVGASTARPSTCQPFGANSSWN